MQVVRNNRYDKMIFKEILDSSSLVQDLVEGENVEEGTSEKTVLHDRDFVEDIFDTLFKHKVELKDKIPTGRILQQSVLKEMLQNPRLRELRQDTVFDGFASAMGTLAIQNEIENTIDEELANQQEKLENLALEEAAKEKALEFLKESLKDLTPEKTGYHTKKISKVEKNLVLLKKAIDKEKDELEKALSEKQHIIRQASRKALKKAEEEVQKTTELLSGWSNEPGLLTKDADVKKRFELMKRLRHNPRMVELTRMIGRLKRLARSKQRTKSVHARDELYSITTGDDLQRVIPTELAFLQNKATRSEFYRKYSEARLLQYDLKGTEPQGKGPIICCCDCSGSMKGPCADWAEATSVALAEVAHTQKRDFVYIGFNNTIVEEISIGKNEDQSNVTDKILTLVSTKCSGGTNFGVPLMKAFALIELNLAKADIVFITDGVYNLDSVVRDTLVEEKKTRETRIFGIKIGSQSDTYKDSQKGLFDVEFQVEDLIKDGNETLEAIFSTI